LKRGKKDGRALSRDWKRSLNKEATRKKILLNPGGGPATGEEAAVATNQRGRTNEGDVGDHQKGSIGRANRDDHQENRRLGHNGARGCRKLWGILARSSVWLTLEGDGKRKNGKNRDVY